jgi:hypothetical protein
MTRMIKEILDSYFAAMVAVVAILALSSCTYPLKINNIDMYNTPYQIGAKKEKLNVAITPFKGKPDDMFYFNEIVRSLAFNLNVASLKTDYIPMREADNDDPADLILSISPSVTYRSSGWNFIINWPGFLIFTPAWNGYVYYADIMTPVKIQNNRGDLLQELEVPMTYDIREAEFDRTVWTGVTWLEVSALALFGGIYNAQVFDRDIIGTFQMQVKDNYTGYIIGQLVPKIDAASRMLKRE